MQYHLLRRLTNPRLWTFVVFMAGATTAAFLVYDNALTSHGGYLYAAIVFVIAACITGLTARGKLRDNIEDEFVSWSPTIGRKLRVFFYEATLLCAVIVLLAGAAALLTHSAIVRGLSNPFAGPASPGQMFLFFIDQAFKGAFYDIARVYEIDIPGVLAVDAKKHVAFGALLVAFRWTASFVLAAGVGLLFYRLFIKRRRSVRFRGEEAGGKI
jgi:hypothetical protein